MREDGKGQRIQTSRLLKHIQELVFIPRTTTLRKEQEYSRWRAVPSTFSVQLELLLCRRICVTTSVVTHGSYSLIPQFLALSVWVFLEVTVFPCRQPECCRQRHLPSSISGLEPFSPQPGECILPAGHLWDARPCAMDLSHSSSFIIISTHHPTDEKTAAQRAQVTCLRPHSFQGANMTVFSSLWILFSKLEWYLFFLFKIVGEILQEFHLRSSNTESGF